MKYIILFFLLVSIANAIKIDVSIDKSKKKIENTEISALTEMFRMNKINISKKNAKEVIRDNRLLANQYIKEYGLKDEYITTLKLSVEKDLAEKIVAENLKNLKVSDDVLKSYYIDNKSDFKKDDEVEIKIYEFEDYDSAYKFYKLFVDKTDKIDSYAHENNISEKTIKSPIRNLNIMIAIVADVNSKKVNTLSYPIFINKKFIILNPVKYHTDLYDTYASKRDDIRLKLLLKISDDKRKELLEKYR